MRSLPLRFLPVVAAAAVVLAASPPAARAAETQPTCIRYVDPVAGNDGAVGTLSYPWKTINRALYGNNPVAYGDVVVLLPGIYSPSTNGEFWPLSMRDGVSLQGTNALNTILQGEADEFGNKPNILNFFAGSMDQTFEDTLVDGVTITNGESGIILNTEFIPVRPTIANCFIVKNEVGVRIISIYHATVDVDGYVNHEPRLINDTIAQNGIGILDEGIWVPSDPDPDGTVNGEADSCIVNCIVYPNALSDLEGVDDEDISATAFCTTDAAGVSQVKNNTPFTYVSVCGLGAIGVYVWPARWDYRIQPLSPFVDQGTTDLSVANGSVGRRLFQCHQDIFDVDCEGYFNARLVNGIPDIGADELGQLIIAGYAAKTTEFNPGQSTAFMLMTPNPALSGSLFAKTYLGSGATGYTYYHPLSVPGVRPKGTTAPAETSEGAMVVNPNLLLPGYPLTFGMPPVGTALQFQQTSATPTRRNVQVLPTNGSSQTTLSNLQSYTIVP